MVSQKRSDIYYTYHHQNVFSCDTKLIRHDVDQTCLISRIELGELAWEVWMELGGGEGGSSDRATGAGGGEERGGTGDTVGLGVRELIGDSG